MYKIGVPKSDEKWTLFRIFKSSKTLVPLVEKSPFFGSKNRGKKLGGVKTINHLWTEPKRDPIDKSYGMDFPTTI